MSASVLKSRDTDKLVSAIIRRIFRLTMPLQAIMIVHFIIYHLGLYTSTALAHEVLPIIYSPDPTFNYDHQRPIISLKELLIDPYIGMVNFSIMKEYCIFHRLQVATL